MRISSGLSQEPAPTWAAFGGAVLGGIVLSWAASPAEVYRSLRMPVVAPGGWGLSEVALPLCAAVAWLLLGWVAAVLVLASLSRVAGCHRGVTRLLRLLLPGTPGQFLGGVLGLALAAATSPDAARATAVSPPILRPQSVAIASAPAAPAPQPDLDWPTTQPVPTPTPDRGREPKTAGGQPRPRPLVIVRPGDSLWYLAASQLRAEGARPTERAVVGGEPRADRGRPRSDPGRPATAHPLPAQ